MCGGDVGDGVFVSTPTTYRSLTGARPITNTDLSNRTSVSGVLEERFKGNLPPLTSSSPKQNLSLRYSVPTMESWVVNNARFMGGYSGAYRNLRVTCDHLRTGDSQVTRKWLASVAQVLATVNNSKLGWCGPVLRMAWTSPFFSNNVNCNNLSLFLDSWVPAPRVLGNRKKIYRVDFFGKASFSGLTNYVIRHNSQNGNMMSLPRALCSRWPRCLTSLANPPCWSLFERYALKVIL